MEIQRRRSSYLFAAALLAFALAPKLFADAEAAELIKNDFSIFVTIDGMNVASDDYDATQKLITLKSLLNRELRSLGDVKIVTSLEDADYTMNVTLFVRDSISMYSATFMTVYSELIYPIQCRGKYEHTGGTHRYNHFGGDGLLGVRSESLGGLKATAEAIVAAFDTDLLEEQRQLNQQTNERFRQMLEELEEQ